jgi:hypothetical protein
MSYNFLISLGNLWLSVMPRARAWALCSIKVTAPRHVGLAAYERELIALAQAVKH